jgi:predicted transcriptional regulator
MDKGMANEDYELIEKLERLQIPRSLAEYVSRAYDRIFSPRTHAT